MKFASFLFATLVTLFTISHAPAQEVDTSGSSAYSYGSSARMHPTKGVNGMVTAIEPLAARAGRDILAQGGNAVDAAVATGFALAVTHPEAGNIGGGGFMMISLPELDEVIALDYREMAPAAAYRDMLLDENGDYDTDRAIYSYLGTGVPGSVMGMTQALKKYGTLPLKQVMAPAIRLAESGYILNYAKEEAFEANVEDLKRDPSTAEFFFKADGTTYKMGERLKQPVLARTLNIIAEQGAKGFYEGEIAALIVAEMDSNRGLITLDDLKNYKAIERKPIIGTFRGHEIYTMPPASSGGIHLVQMLNILEGYDLKSMGHNSADYIAALVESMRRAYADRSEYLGDPAYTDVPVEELIDKAYADKLRAQINLKQASLSTDISPGLEAPYESPQTTHYSVMDKDGGAVSVTTTINLAYGGGGSVDGAGFFLNNEMDDFSAKPGTPNAFGLIGGVANEIEPGKRPLSSMTPTIVQKDGEVVLVTGSPGGSTIITIVMQMVLNVIEFNMNIAEASVAPRVHHQWLPDVLMTEAGVSQDTLDILRARNFILPATPAGGGSPYSSTLGRTNSITHHDGIYYGFSDLRGLEYGVAGY
ncbi:MAG: gamma-glutamyltransferase [Kordiimonadaceae bacterium]|jgi:gamma-glutamyltranspeptidase / glutathione hydrolase|nr:gamma-glutamyltransferase [Kordiimonadaceae bacterium]